MYACRRCHARGTAPPGLNLPAALPREAACSKDEGLALFRYRPRYGLRLHKGVEVSFRRVSIIGTLAAVALALLVILPVFAQERRGLSRVKATNDYLQVEVGTLVGTTHFR